MWRHVSPETMHTHTEKETREYPSTDLSYAFHHRTRLLFFSPPEIPSALVQQSKLLKKIYCFPYLSFCLKSVSNSCIPPSSFSLKQNEKRRGKLVCSPANFPLFLFRGYVPKTKEKETQTNNLTKKRKDNQNNAKISDKRTRTF